MVQLLSIEIDAVCIAIGFILLFRLNRDNAVQLEKHLFIREIWMAIILYFVDVICYMIEDRILPMGILPEQIAITVYMLQVTMVSYGWFIYNENELNPQFYKSRIKKLFCLIPLFVLLVILLFNFKTNDIFYISSNNHFHRGRLYIIQPLFSFGYVVGAFIRASIYYYREKNYAKKKNYASLMFFVIYPSICTVLQLVTGAAGILHVGITLSLLTIFLNQQELQISLDHLTQLNNRMQLSRFLLEFSPGNQKDQETYFLMIDIDGFKIINDTYGHIEGDFALRRVAKILKEICDNRNCFLARYGGDEFMVIYQCYHVSEVQQLIDKIGERIETENLRANRPYQISLSIGYVKYTDDMQGTEDAIAAADMELYRKKMVRRQNLALEKENQEGKI